jgi:hypothetical protein
MERINVEVRRHDVELEAQLVRLRKLAQLFDAQFSIAGIRFGMDAIIGLIPGVGDTITAVIGLYPIYVANKHKLGKRVQARMAANLLIDWALGSVPVAGDAFDVFFKSFLKNVALLEKAAEKRDRTRPGNL